MKKITLLFAFFCICGIGYSQKVYEKRVNHFTDAAASTYKLNEEQTKELRTARTTYLKTLASLDEQTKKEQITLEEKQTKTKQVNKEFKELMVKLTGQNEKELEPFFTRMREELKNL